MLNTLTIIIPTYKRYSYLIRLLKFLNLYKNPIKILILDSTPENLYNEKIHEIINNDRITHISFDANVTFWDKIAIGAQNINTEFVTLCADDDFIIPNAAVSCMEFLKENKNYSSAHGLFFQHPNYDTVKNMGFSLTPLYEERIDSFGDTASERLTSYLSGKGLNPLYAVHRSSILSLIWSETSKYISDWNLHETFPCCLSAIYGKTKRLPIFYASRESNNFRVNNYENIKRTYSPEKVSRAVEGVTEHLSQIDRISIEEAESVVSRAFAESLIKVKKKFSKKEAPNISFAIRLKHYIRLRTRLRIIMFQGCHPSIYPNYLNDYKKVKKAVISAGLDYNDLNQSRKDY